MRVEDEAGNTGHGEGAPSKFFGEHVDELLSRLQGAAQWLESASVRTPADVGRAWEEAWHY